jgi:hypothetical protein
MTSAIPFERTFLSLLDTDHDVGASGRALLIASLFAAVPLTMQATQARTDQLNSAETTIILPDAVRWSDRNGGPPHSGQVATLYGALDRAGSYLVLMRWTPVI